MQELPLAQHGTGKGSAEVCSRMEPAVGTNEGVDRSAGAPQRLIGQTAASPLWLGVVRDPPPVKLTSRPGCGNRGRDYPSKGPRARACSKTMFVSTRPISFRIA